MIRALPHGAKKGCVAAGSERYRTVIWFLSRKILDAQPDSNLRSQAFGCDACVNHLEIVTVARWVVSDPLVV